MSEGNNNPFEDQTTDHSNIDTEKQDTFIEPFEDQTTDLSDPDPEEQDAAPDNVCINTFDDVAIDSEEQKNSNTQPKIFINPFDDPSKLLGVADPGNHTTSTSDNRVRYDCDEDEDSVRSMLEMMETKNYSDPKQRHSKINSMRAKARGVSLTKWSWRSPASLLGVREDSTDDDDSLESYDCIALSSLKTILRKDGKFEHANEGGDDEESPRFKPRRDGGDDKSDGTTTTKNSVNESDADSLSCHLINRSNKLKYIVLVALFLATILLLGILVLSYSLYALRNEEEGDVSVFTKEFWRGIWKDDNNDNSGGD